MFEPTRATTLTIESSSAFFFGARISAETSGGPPRKGLTASSYRALPKPLAARPQLRPCDLRKPRSIRRKQMTPNPLPKNRFGSGVTPRPVVHEPHIQLAGANLYCGQTRSDLQRVSAADLYPGHTAIGCQNPRAGDLSCAHHPRDTQGPPGTRLFPANRVPTLKPLAPENIWLNLRLPRDPTTSRFSHHFCSAHPGSAKPSRDRLSQILTVPCRPSHSMAWPARPSKQKTNGR